MTEVVTEKSGLTEAKKKLKKEKDKARREHLEKKLLVQIRGARLPEPVCQYKFSPGRKFLLDFAWPEIKFGVEVQGGTYLPARLVTRKNGSQVRVEGGGHNRASGYTRDCEKLGEALIHGWRIYWCDSKLVTDGSALVVIEKVVRMLKEQSRHL